MVHPVKTPIDVVRAVSRVSLGAARHPLRTAGDIAAQGRGLVAALVTGHRGESPAATVERSVPEATPASPRKQQGDPVADAARDTPQAAQTASGETPDETPDEMAGEQIVTEPSSVTGPGDDEEIPSPAVQPEDDDVEVITPVGTTGAGAGYNPDTTESDLQQPGTEPLMDPATTKRIKSESETLSKASDPKKD